MKTSRKYLALSAITTVLLISIGVTQAQEVDEEYDNTLDLLFSTEPEYPVVENNSLNNERVIPTSEKVQLKLPLTREEVINEYIRARNAGELDYYKEVLYTN